MRSFIISTLLLLTVFGLSAQRTVELSVPQLSAKPGATVRVPVNLTNTEEVTALQFRLTVPSGFVLAPEFTQSIRLDGTHTATIRRPTVATLDVLIYSGTNAAIRGNAGEIGYVNLTVPSNVSDGSTHAITVSNGVAGNAAGQENLLTGSSNGVLHIATLPDLAVGDVTFDASRLNPDDNIDVSWTVSNLGGDDYIGGWHEEIALVNSSGSTLKLYSGYHDSETFASNATTHCSARVTIPSTPGMEGDVQICVKITPSVDGGESTATSANDKALSDAVANLSKRLTLTLADNVMDENDGKIKCTLTRSGDRSKSQSFSITPSGDTRRLSAPETVTISSTYSSTTFYISAVDNYANDGDASAQISVSGNGYDAVSADVSIINDDFPELSITPVTDDIHEGDDFELVVSLGCQITDDVTVALSSDMAYRLSVPQTVVIPAGYASRTVTCTLVDDDELRTDDVATIYASADGYERADCVVTLIDNDIPQLEMYLSDDSMILGCDLGDVTATIKRTSQLDEDITIEISDDSESLLYFKDRRINMAAGVSEVVIPIATEFGRSLAAPKDVTITAAIYSKSCKCTAPQETGGSASATITVIDDRQPAVGLVLQRNIIDYETTKIKCYLNIPAALDHDIVLSLVADDALDVPATITMEAGKKSKIFYVSLANEDVPTGIYNLQVSAPGYIPAKKKVIVSNDKAPDFAIKNFKILDSNPYIGGKLLVSFDIFNQGNETANCDVVMESDPVLINGTYCMPITDMPPGRDYTYENFIIPLDKNWIYGGKYTLVMTLDKDNKTNDRDRTNNTVSFEFEIKSPYTFTCHPTKDVYLPGEKPTLKGTVANSRGDTFYGTSFIVMISSPYHGVTEEISYTSSQEFTYQVPGNLEPGTYEVRVYYGGAIPENPTCTFTIPGLVAANRLIIDATKDEALDGKIRLYNPCDIDFTTVGVEDDDSDTFILEGGSVNGFPAHSVVEVPFTVLGTRLTEGNDYIRKTFTAYTDYGVTAPVDFYYYVWPKQPRLTATIKGIEATVVDNNPREIAFTLYNSGMGKTGDISLSLPAGITALTPITMPGLDPGDSTTVCLTLATRTDPRATGQKGKIAINCRNGAGLAIPYDIKYTSDASGTLRVNVQDEFSYYTPEGEPLQQRAPSRSAASIPGVANAAVTLIDRVTGNVALTATTDADGSISSQLLSGPYRMKVEAPDHYSYESDIYIEADRDNVIDAFISLQAVKYDWVVVETDVEDTYEIETVADFAVQVPKPVVTVDYPEDGVPVLEPFELTVTNHGLIEALDTEIKLDVSGDFKYAFIDNPVIDVLPAHSQRKIRAIVIPNDLLDIPSTTSAPQRRDYGIDEDGTEWIYEDSVAVLPGWRQDNENVYGNSGNIGFLRAKYGVMCIVLDTKWTFRYLCGGLRTVSERKTYGRITRDCEDYKSKTIKAIGEAAAEHHSKSKGGQMSYPMSTVAPGSVGAREEHSSAYDKLVPVMTTTNGPCAKNYPRAARSMSTAIHEITEIMGKAPLSAPASTESVCAVVKLSFKQSAVLTRQGFTGTLTITNGLSLPLEDIRLYLDVRDAEGVMATSREIDIVHTSHTGFEGADAWTLAPGAEGTAEYLFTPTQYAAPDEPQVYSFGGTLTMTDPSTGKTAYIHLTPVDMTVEPTPLLDLTYFMQRDVMGDDALTPEVEMSVPAEFSLLVTNVGVGQAKNLKITTTQPEIIENEKGLLIDYSIISSQLNGKEHTLALGGRTETDFGNIPPGASAFASWWMESSLLGHFSNYDVTANHVTSHGNPDLSLLRNVSVHELIRGLSYTDSDGNPARAFLTNDIEDDNNLPDNVYLTDGTVADVAIASAHGEWVDNDSYKITLGNVAHAAARGVMRAPAANEPADWIYVKMPDPTAGQRAIVSVKRMSDNKVIAPSNAWLTDLTLIDFQAPLYENILHLADSPDTNSESYLITFGDKKTSDLDVSEFIGIPTDGIFYETPANIKVRFSKEVNYSSISAGAANVQLYRDGEAVAIPAANLTYSKGTLTVRTDNIADTPGDYMLAIDCSKIRDTEGFYGTKTYYANWTLEDNTYTFVHGQNYTQTETIDDVAVIYQRNFKNTSWQAMYVPFDMSYDEWKEFGDIAEINAVHQFDDDNDGEFEETVIEFRRLHSGKLRPNTPYMVKPYSTGEVNLLCLGKTLHAAPAVNGAVWCASTHHKYVLTGIYQPKPDMEGVYALSKGEFKRGTASSPALGACQIYMTIENVDNGYGMPDDRNFAPERVLIAVDDEVEGITGIGNDASDDDAPCYDILGRPAEHRQSGIYLKRGLKIVIKD